MPGRGAPSFLKRQKEQARAAHAAAKRAAKQARRERKAAGLPSDDLDLESTADANDSGPGMEPDTTDES